MMELEFTARTKIIYGRTPGEEQSRTDYNSAVSRDPMRSAGTGGAAGETGTDLFRAESISETAVGGAQFVSDPNTDGRPTEVGTASGSDSRTGWEKEREAFLASEIHTTQTVPAGMGVANGADRSVDVGGIISSVVQLGRWMEQAHAPVIDGSARHHKDRKTWLNELDKRIAMGHKEDDHEDEPTWSMRQTM